MANSLFLVSHIEYPGDCILIMGETDEDIVTEYCRETGETIVDVDEFFDSHRAEEITRINGKRIREIILE